MSNLARLYRNDAATAELYLGPATMVVPGTRDVEVRLEGGARVNAQLALALPYVPAEDDVVLVLGKDERHYVVGVLHSSGRTALTFRGNVKLQAVGGSLDLAADEGVRVKGRAVELEARELRMSAQSLVQKFQSVVQRVRGLLRVRAERTDTIVDESALTKAKSASIVTEETMAINGKQIHLG
jgi:hypothetical protein